MFPTLDGKVVAGPTAVDQEDKDDWSVRPEAADGDPAQGGARCTRRSRAPSRSPPTRACGRPAAGVNYAIGAVGGVPGRS